MRIDRQMLVHRFTTFLEYHLDHVPGEPWDGYTLISDTSSIIIESPELERTIAMSIVGNEPTFSVLRSWSLNGKVIYVDSIEFTPMAISYEEFKEVVDEVMARFGIPTTTEAELWEAFASEVGNEE